MSRNLQLSSCSEHTINYRQSATNYKRGYY
ncbi:uncharacterized protein FPRO_15886 [Fusarium proliferatum ET1]|uniref:Uncharacterized protein n=1 Tax=Fusarium proliferatum (strain ET1) TaxID=1227346 RepID=A0A1L7WA65_FUSPR|nr:uncharacterized protein FPRO_15886 [Fusarium proliferatum ET1]CZR49527.1 uncharacterized protein FPRO_15886 [Fusarium proliferatum ET1]